MIKDIIQDNENVTPNDKEMAILREHFPSCFKSDGSFDLVRFSEFLKDKIDVTQEGYELKFLGKNYARMLASLDTETVLVPDEAHNALPENANSENIYISGDNLDGLKHLLKSYAGKVKCIYIDPPYNTGTDGFVYNDKFTFTAEELASKLSIDEEQAARILDLARRGSASHSAWLMFMLPRLQLARDLLKKEGVIVISIDDNEQSNLTLLCDEIFGEDNFLGMIAWKNATDNNPTNISIEHEYILCYARDKGSLEPVWKSQLSGIKDVILSVEEQLLNRCGGDAKALQQEYTRWYIQNKSQLGKLDGYKYCDCGGVYAGSRSVHNPGKHGYFYDVIHPITGKPCTPPLMGYRFPEDSMKELIAQDKIIYGEDEKKIIEIKQYVRDYEDKLSSVIAIDGRSGANAIRSLFNNVSVFKNPKTPLILEEILPFIVNDGDIVLDFFAGSSTTAHAIMNLNARDDRHRKYILVQWQEKTKADSEAEKAGFETIDQIGIERIIRAAKKIREEHPNTTADLGFKHYTLREVSQTTLDKIEKFDNSGFVTDTTVYDEFGASTVLTTWLVHDGYSFVNRCVMLDLVGYTAYWCENHLYLINPGLTEDAVKTLIDKYNSQGDFNPQNIVVFGYSFNFVEMENLKTNVKILRDSEKNLKVNLDIRY